MGVPVWRPDLGEENDYVDVVFRSVDEIFGSMVQILGLCRSPRVYGPILGSGVSLLIHSTLFRFMEKSLSLYTSLSVHARVRKHYWRIHPQK